MAINQAERSAISQLEPENANDFETARARIL